MSSITSLNSNGYYSLNNQSTSDTTTTASAADVLSQVAAANSASASSASADSSYLLNLSPEAQSYLQSLAAGTSSTANASDNIFGTSDTSGNDNIFGSSASAATPTNTSDNYVLTRAQQKTLTAIIAKYKDAPYTQNTFDSIQKDLDAAGLSTDTLAAQEKVRNFNTTAFLLDALNGTDSGQSSALDNLTGGNGTSSADAQKASNFMGSVLTQWQTISTTMDPATDS